MHHGDEFNRLAESAEVAFYEGNGECRLIVWENRDSLPSHYVFSNRFEADGIKILRNRRIKCLISIILTEPVRDVKVSA